jgi:hypothetical protein
VLGKETSSNQVGTPIRILHNVSDMVAKGKTVIDHNAGSLISFRFGRTASPSFEYGFFSALRLLMSCLHLANDVGMQLSPVIDHAAKYPIHASFLDVSVYLHVQFDIIGMHFSCDFLTVQYMSVMSLIYSNNNRGPRQLPLDYLSCELAP